MGAAARMRRSAVATSFAIGCLLAVGITALAFGAAAPSGARGASRLSLQVPAQAASGSSISARGQLFGEATRGRIEVRARSAGTWSTVAKGPARGRRFALAFAVPAERRLEVRAVLVAAGRTAALSPIRRIAVRPAVVAAPRPSVTPPVTAPVPAGTPAATPAPGTGGETPPVPPPPPTKSYWGAWIGNQLTGEEAPWDMGAVEAFEDKVGKAPSIIEFASPFADCTHKPCSFYPFPSTPFEDIRAHGSIPMLSWSSQSLPASPQEPEYELADIARGDYDSYIHEFAAAAAAWGHPFFLRFDWEMNGGWFPWGAGANNNTAADYVAAWRHVHQVFAEAGADDATWVWCPYVDPNSTLADLASLYPGDDDVDWTCLDGYNWGPSANPPRKWRSFSFLFGPSYRLITESIAPTKPMMVGETSSSETGGSKSEWISQAFAALPTEFPRIRGFVWFEKNSDGMDWPVETSTAATSAFAAAVADPRYLGDQFGGLATAPIPAP